MWLTTILSDLFIDPLSDECPVNCVRFVVRAGLPTCAFIATRTQVESLRSRLASLEQLVTGRMGETDARADGLAGELKSRDAKIHALAQHAASVEVRTDARAHVCVRVCILLLVMGGLKL